MSFSKFVKFSANISFNHFSALFLLLELSQCICWSTWQDPIGLLDCVYFSFIYLFLRFVIFIFLSSCSLIHSLCSNLPLNISSEIFSAFIVLFISIIWFWFLFRFLYLMFPFCSYTVFLTFSTTSYRFLRASLGSCFKVFV